MSSSNPEFDSQSSDELVAYLDGELPQDECRRVEERLAGDADYRQQLRDLDQAWEALDSLPATNVDDQFARTTIEMVAVDAEREATQQAVQSAATARKRYWLWTAAGLAAAGIGFAATRMLLSDANHALIDDLHLIQQVDVLSQIESVDFLQRLARDVPVERFTQDSISLSRELAALHSASAESSAERRRWVAGLSPEQKAALVSQINRFNALQKDSEKLRHLERLQQEIQRSANADALQRTLVAYGQWLMQREPWEQEDLRVLPTDERVEEIQRMMREDEQRAARHLSDDDKDKLRKEIFEIFNERKSAFERAVRRREHDDRRWLEGPSGGQALMVVLWELRNERDEKTTERLIKQLGPEQREYWQSLPRRSRRNERRDQRDQLVHWIREAIQLRPGPEELDRFFANPDKLDNDQRQWLLALPREEMQVQLERLYMADQLGLRGAAEWLNEYGGPRGLPPVRPPSGFGRGRPDTDRPGSAGPPPHEGRDRQRPPDRPRPPAPDDPPAAQQGAE
jgi:hypothetical protein